VAYNDGYKGRKDSIKAWVNFTQTSTAVKGSYNVSSVTDQGTGRCRINFTTAMSDTNYACLASSHVSSGDPKNYSNGSTINNASSADFIREDSGGVAHDTTQDCFYLVIGN
tara:strand:- start:256 stop:588 length:333 start_codon:yes stop_codon:yes gene_type:complete